MKYEYKLTAEDYRDWIMFNLTTKKRRMVRLCCLAAYLLFAFCMTVRVILAGADARASVPVLLAVIVIGILVIRKLSDRQQFKLLWKQSGAERMEREKSFPRMILMYDSLGFTLEAKGSGKKDGCAWRDTTAFEETPRLFLIGTGKDMWQLVAKSAFRDEEQAAVFRRAALSGREAAS